MEGTASLIEILHTLKKRWKLITMITIAAALISAAVSYYVLAPVYQASTQILVNQKSSDNQLDYSSLQSNVDFINTYSDIIKSPVILEKVITQLDLKESEEQLNKRISINSRENSQVFSLVVEDENASEAVLIANTLSETFQQDIPTIMNVNNVSILARAELKENPIPVKPNRLFNIIVALVVGFLLGIAIAFLRELMDNTLKDEGDIASYTGLPVLGSVQKLSSSQMKKERITTVQTKGSETVVS